MDIWSMTQPEFIGPIPVVGWPSPPLRDWHGSGAILRQNIHPDVQTRRLSGCNTNYVISPVVGAPQQFVALHPTNGALAIVGIYDDTIIMMDPAHSGHWISEELVIAAWSVRNCTPNMPRQLTTMSEKTFRRAHELAVRRAHARLEKVHADNIVLYGLPDWKT